MKNRELIFEKGALEEFKEWIRTDKK